MSYSFDYAVIGGDNRQLFLADLLSRENVTVCYYGLTPSALPSRYIPSFMNHTLTASSSLKEAIESSKVIIGPTPFCKDRVYITSATDLGILIDDFFAALKKEQKVYAGAIPTPIEERAKSKGFTFIDIMKWEPVSMLNSIATAEGAICEAIQHSIINLQGSKVLILGFGRCGQILAKKLSALDANVSVSVRKPEILSYAKAYGYSGFLLNELESNIAQFDFIFNTIPTMVIPKNLLKLISFETAIIDIASSPGGIDFNYANDHYYNAGLYLGLPGKMSPKTSAKILLDAILEDCNHD